MHLPQYYIIMVLPAEASKSILILNNNIPEDQKKLWVTIPEIRDRLVAAGVDRNLSDDHVLHAITHFNNDVFLTRWHDSGVAYYRSPEYVYECPYQQRWKESGLPDRTTAKSILSTASTFIWNDTCRQKLHMLNKVLIGLDNHTNQKKKSEENEKSNTNNDENDDASTNDNDDNDGDASTNDVLTCFQEYKPHIGDDAERTKCLRRINAIVPHHCGKHHHCEWEEFFWQCGRRSERKIM